MIAGICSFNPEHRVSPEMRAELRASLSRHTAEDLREFDVPGAFIVRATTGALSDDDGFILHDRTCASVLAGEPLAVPSDRSADHRFVAEAVARDDLAALSDVRGVFCGARYSAEEGGVLELFTDKLGVRPIYVWSGDGLVVFATAQRVLEALSWIPLERDEIGIAEIVGIGYALGHRTRYRGVRVLEEAELLRITRRGEDSTTYFRWAEVSELVVTVEDAVTECYRLFKDAVAARRRDDRDVVAYLSGGMDSRAIVAALKDLGAGVRVVNFSPRGSQDQEFARRFAQRIGCELREAPLAGVSERYRVELATLMRDYIDSGAVNADRPRAVWSGDGGSVSLGCVYLDDEALRLLRTGNLDRAVAHFRERNNLHLPVGLLTRDGKRRLFSLLDERIAAEVLRHDTADPAQALFLFLMANDQRRHLNDFFEELDRHRLEYQLPFFDSKLLEFVFGLPLDLRMSHRFYDRWFGAFPAAVREVPWQTYPGHVPCPLPIPDGLDTQWHIAKAGKRPTLRQRIDTGGKGLALLASGRDLGPVSRARFLAVSLAQLFGVGSYGYAMRAADLFSRRPHEL